MSSLDLYQKVSSNSASNPLDNPVDRTAIAQAEIEEKAQEGTLHYIIFGVEGDLPPIEIATTRPELLAGCGAIMIHPTHPRAQELKGKHAITPLFHMAVPFIEDDKVDPEKGSGMVMCCTCIFTDIAGKTHICLCGCTDSAGKIRSDIIFGEGDWQSQDMGGPSRFGLKNLKAKVARSEIIRLLDDIGVVARQEKSTRSFLLLKFWRAAGDYHHPQWFIKTFDYKVEILRLGQKFLGIPRICITCFRRAEVEMIMYFRANGFWRTIPVWLSKGKARSKSFTRKDQLPVDPLSDLPDGPMMPRR